MQFSYSNRFLGMKPSIIREILKQMGDPSLISFAGGNPAASSFPVQQIRQCSAEILQNEPTTALQYSVTEGDSALRAAAQQFANREFLVAKESDELIITSGSQQIMDFLCKVLCNEGDTVVVEEPAFLGAYNAMASYGARLVGVPLQPDGADLAQLEAAFAATPKPRFFYCIPNFQNPTGICTSAEKRREIYRLAVQYGVPILEDDPYGLLRISGTPLPPIKSFDTEGAVLYAASFSKIFCPGLRLAYCVGAPELLAKLVVAKQVSDVHTNIFAQRICQQVLATLDMNAHLQRLQQIYREKAGCMMQQLDAQLGARVQYHRPEGGMFLWLTLPSGLDIPQFTQNCLAKKLAIVPGSAFFTNEQAAAACHSVRLNFSTPTVQQIAQGVKILDTVLQEMGF